MTRAVSNLFQDFGTGLFLSTQDLDKNVSKPTKKRHPSNNIGGEKKKIIESDTGSDEDDEGMWTIATGTRKKNSPSNPNPSQTVTP